MRILSVDLAAKYSAAMVTDHDRQVHTQFDSLEMSSFAFARELRRAADHHEVGMILIEDVPYGITGQGQVKSPLRLQGVVALALHPYIGTQLHMVNPSTWQGTFPGVARAPKGVSKVDGAKARLDAAATAALGSGYTPPNLVGQYEDEIRARDGDKARVLKKHTAPLAKVQTDYVDAWLMAEWARRLDYEISGLPGVQPFLL